MVGVINGKRSADCCSVNRVSLADEEFIGVEKSLGVNAVGAEYTVLDQDGPEI